MTFKQMEFGERQAKTAVPRTGLRPSTLGRPGGDRVRRVAVSSQFQLIASLKVTPGVGSRGRIFGVQMLGDHENSPTLVSRVSCMRFARIKHNLADRQSFA
jgi:hypothetical protein